MNVCEAHGGTRVKDEGTFKALLAFRSTKSVYGDGCRGNCSNSTGGSDSVAGRAGGSGDMVMPRGVI